MPGSTSSPAIPRRAAHCVHRVTVPSPSTTSSRSTSGVACGSTMSPARPGRASQLASPLSQRDTSTPAATAAAATVRAWLQASGRSTPDVTEITRVRMAAGYAGGRAASSAVARGAAGGGHPRRHRRIGTCSRSRGSSSGCWSLRPCRSAGSPATSSTSSTRASADVPFAIPDGLAPEVYPLAWLVGRWQGEGVIVYPTIPERPVRQEVVVDHDGGPYLTWSSTLWPAGAGGAVWATESGYWRLPSDRPEELSADQHLVELLLSDPAGHLTLFAGVVGNGRIELASDLIARTPDAAEVTAATRLYGLVGGELMWAGDIAAFGQPLQSYASAQLRRV